MKLRTPAKDRLLKLYRQRADTKTSPDRRWFGNTRLISQTQLDTYRDVYASHRKNPYSVLIKRTKLPVSLLDVPGPQRIHKKSGNLLKLESYETTFGKNQHRKRAKLQCDTLEELATDASRQPDLNAEETSPPSLSEHPSCPPEEIFRKGTSRRIWKELYKVVDSSDVIVEVLDARNPSGTRCQRLERHIRHNHPHKHIVLLLNKCDLVPTWCATRWLKILASEHPTIAFRSSLKASFGKMDLINLLRQYAALLKDRQHVSVGFIGYPNVGKSSVINTLKYKKVCTVAPIPGETKVWQYISLTRRIHLIDCPGIVPLDDAVADSDKVLVGVVRAEKLQEPEQYIQAVVDAVEKKALCKVYRVKPEDWTSSTELLEILAHKTGKLLKGGSPDISTVARSILYDFQRGKIPYYVKPPFSSSEPQSS